MSTDDEKDLLTRELRHRSEHADVHPIALATVKRSARRMQWRRRAAGGVVAAAVLAVAVPVGLNVTGTTSSEPPIANQPAPTASTTTRPSPSPEQTPTDEGTLTPTVPEDGSVVLTTQGIGRGAAPAVEYLQGRTLVRADGGTEQLPAAYSSIYPFHGGWIAIEYDNRGRTFVVQLDSADNVVSRERGGSRIAVSADGVEVAYVVRGAPGSSSRLVHMIANGMGEGGDSVDVPDDASPVGFVGPGRVVYSTQGVEPTTWVTDFSETHQVPDVMGARAATNGLVGAQTSYNDQDGTSCWRVVSDSLDEVSSTCDFTLEAFSPDGRHAFGWNSDAEGIGSRTVAILDPATAKAVTVFRVPNEANAFVTSTVWEDDDHLLAETFQDGSWHLLRLGVDGSVEDTVDPVEAADVDAPWQFSARP